MPTSRNTLIARAMAACEIEKVIHEETVFLQVRLHITDQFKPDTEEGKPWDPLNVADELDAGQTAIVRRFWAEAPALSLTAWIENEAARFVVTPPGEKTRDKRTGKARLAAALLGLPYTAPTRASKTFKALLRSLQRAGLAVAPGRKQSHVTISKKSYIELINAYAGSGSPFAPGNAIAQLDRMADNLPNLGIDGSWWISERFYPRRLLHTSWIINYEPQTMHEARAVARNDGRDFIETVIRHCERAVGGYSVVLETAYWLVMQGGLDVIPLLLGPKRKGK